MNVAIERFASISQKFGIWINDRKTVVMCYDPHNLEQAPISIGNTQLQCVTTFNYLGSIISPGNDLNAEFQRRTFLARTTFFKLMRRLWNQRGIRRCTKARMFNALVTSTFLYGSGSWTRREADTNRPGSTEYRLTRQMLGARPTDHVRMTTAYAEVYMVPYGCIL